MIAGIFLSLCFIIRGFVFWGYHLSEFLLVCILWALLVTPNPREDVYEEEVVEADEDEHPGLRLFVAFGAGSGFGVRLGA